MKTSNKILLTFFVAAILMMTAVHLTLYAKYKRGDVSLFQEIKEERFEDHPLPAVKYVSVTGLMLCKIIPSAEPKIGIAKNKGSRLKYTVVNDTLVITGDSTATMRDFEHDHRTYESINLYLPGVETVNAFYTGLLLHGGADSTKAVSCSVNLSNKSRLTVGTWGNKPDFFNQVQIKAASSNVDFSSSAVIDQLNLQADESQVENHASIKHLQLQMDEQSTIILRGNSLKDINVLKK